MPMTSGPKLKRMAILVGGGPAPGINGVISAATIEALNHGVEVFGMRDGNNWIMKGATELIKLSGDDPAKVTDFYAWVKAGKCKFIKPLELDNVIYIPFKGGSTLGTSRANPTKDPKAMENVLDVYRKLGIDALVSIGGDDTAYSASQVYKSAGATIRVAHVPKTIDNDLPLPGSTPTFGFDTARMLGTQLVRNLAEDARTTSRWYIIISMGRAAGHLALGIGKSSASTLTIIPEEFGAGKISLNLLCDIIIGSIIKRLALDRRYGVAVLAEGLIEKIDEEELLKTLNDAKGAFGEVVRDPFGNLRMGEIEFGRLMRALIAERIKPLKLNTAFIDKDLGYELRCADPTPFDCEYTRDLGYGAVKFLMSYKSDSFGAIISFVNGAMNPLPFDSMLDPKTKRMQTRPVDVDGEGYECARAYMTRLRKEDFTNAETLAKLAGIVSMSPAAFKERFEYVVK
jgi:6-phosphofructokinase